MINSTLFSIILSVFLAAPAIALPIQASHSVTPNQGTVGDLFHYEIQTSFDKSIRFNPPEIGLGLNTFAILGHKIVENILDNNQSVYILRYELAKYKPGEFEIPPITLRYIVNNQLVTRQLETLPLQITSVLPTEGIIDMTDIGATFSLDRNLINRWVPLVVSVALGVTGLGIWGWRKQNLVTTTNRQATTVKKPWDLALRALEKLYKQNSLQKGELEVHYFHLSKILKTFLSRVYGQRMIEWTTGEIVSHLEKKMLATETIKRVRHVLVQSDHVKFARSHPLDQDHAIIHDRFQQLIHQIKEFMS